VINRGGEKVFPHTVEDVLLGDPEVVAAAVVARPDDVLGSVPVAAITTTGDPETVVARLLAACAQQLDRTRRPVDVVVLPSLPGGVNGKVSRKAVRQLLLDRSAGSA
jgi:acyl-CoA synthetase (AMP-forming)/AMP-acid ligase II